MGFCREYYEEGWSPFSLSNYTLISSNDSLAVRVETIFNCGFCWAPQDAVGLL